MPQPNVTCIITHEHPDLDAMLSVLLFKRYGEPLFPGAADAPVMFYPADKLPEGKTPDELEKEGMIALDIGGGRFDTHPQQNMVIAGKLDRCASGLVAEHLGIHTDPRWIDLIEYVRRQDVSGKSLDSKDHLHHLVSLNNIVLGFQIQYREQSEAILGRGIKMLEAIAAHSGIDSAGIDTREMLAKFFDRYVRRSFSNPPTAREDDAPCEWSNLMRWRERLEHDFDNAFSRISPYDELVSLKSILTGLYTLHDGDEASVYEEMRRCFDAMLFRERAWCDALVDLDKHAHVARVGRTTIVTIASENGMVIRAARYRHRADIVIFRNSKTGATSIIGYAKSRRPQKFMANLSVKVRLAECVLRGVEPEYEALDKVGTVHEWFMHQSENLLICGSPKASRFSPSLIPLMELHELVRCQLDEEHALPSPYLAGYVKYMKYVSGW